MPGKPPKTTNPKSRHNPQSAQHGGPGYPKGAAAERAVVQREARAARVWAFAQSGGYGR
jgi:hypothetical protein